MKTMLIFFLLLAQLLTFEEKSNIDVKIINASSLDKIIHERDGKLLLVNIWATWCIPCREEFPDLVKLYDNYKEKVDLVAISVDYEDEIDDKIIPFLNNNNVTFPVYVSGFKDDESLISYFKSEWNGAIPATFLFNAESLEIKKLEGKHSYESFSSIIEENLK